MADRQARRGELSVAESAEGVMLDASDKIANFHASASETPVPREGVSREGGQDRLDLWALKFAVQNDRFIDDLNGLPLDRGLCNAACKKEIEYVHAKGDGRSSKSTRPGPRWAHLRPVGRNKQGRRREAQVPQQCNCACDTHGGARRDLHTCAAARIAVVSPQHGDDQGPGR